MSASIQNFILDVWIALTKSSRDEPVRLTVLALGILGLLVVFKGLIRFLAAIIFLFRKNPRKYGEWAIVTGATDGIGLGYVKALARKGYKVLLISRSEDKLAKTKAELEAKFKTEFRTLSVDFANADYNKIKSELANMDIGVLINNVGCSYEHAEYMHELDEARIEQLIQLNVRSTTYMTRIVLPGMVERKRGAIINVGSAAGTIPIGDPLYSVYSATKAYVDFLARSLHVELASKGVVVQCHVPWFVPTKLSKIRHASLFMPHADKWARASVDSIGIGGPTVVPYWAHRLQDWALFSLIPRSFAVAQVLAHHHGIRKRALKKKAEKAKEGKAN